MTFKQLLKRSLKRREEDQAINEVLGQYDLTIAQWTALGLIQDGNDTVSELSRCFKSSLAFVTNTLNALESKGWVERIGHPVDERSKILRFVGDQGAYDQIEREVKEVIERVINHDLPLL